jgi:hypothetical protein
MYEVLLLDIHEKCHAPLHREVVERREKNGHARI